MSLIDLREDKKMTLELKTRVKAGGQVDAVIPLRWCVSRSLWEHLKEIGAPNPHILIVRARIVDYWLSSPDGRYRVESEERQLIPLQDEMTYVQFTKPGLNSVLACIVYSDDVYEMRKRLLQRKSSSEYQQDIFEYERDTLNIGEIQRALKMHLGKSEDPAPVADCIDTQARYDFDIPKEMFAREPAQWRRDYVALWGMKTYVEDQCDFRKRFWLALPFAPLILTLYMVMRLVGLTAVTLWGHRLVNYSALWHPLADKPWALWQDVSYGNKDNPCPGEGTYWFSRKDGKPRSYKVSIPLAVIHPIVLLLDVVVMWVIVSEDYLDPIYLITPLLVPAIALVIAALGGICVSIFKAYHLRKDTELQPYTPSQIERFYAEIETLACETNRAGQARIADIPKGHRTMRLRYLDTKSRVCKPFAH